MPLAHLLHPISRRSWFCLPALIFAVAMTGLAQAPATTPSSAERLAGNWQFVLNTEGGDRIFPVVFQLEGSRVSGKWDNHDIPEMGTYKDGTLVLSFKHTVAEVEQTDTLNLKATFEGADLKGTWSFSQYSGTFTATRAAN